MIKVWDIAVRTVHWVLVVLMTVSIASGLTGGNAMTWHTRAGVLILAIVLFRLLWGLVGSTTARFTDFIAGPGRVLDFARVLLRGEPAHVHGHNPLGGWMVLALLLSLTLQAGTGLFADDEILTTGPLAGRVSGATSELCTTIHGYNAWVLVGLVCMHIAAVLFHRVVRGENLVLPMFTGARPWPEELPRPALRFAPAWLALFLFALVAGVVYATLAVLGN